MPIIVKNTRTATSERCFFRLTEGAQPDGVPWSSRNSRKSSRDESFSEGSRKCQQKKQEDCVGHHARNCDSDEPQECRKLLSTRKSLIDNFIDRDEEYWKNRITVKIDVAYTDHSHIIGKQGKNTQRVMKETGCHIHFPDSNRNPELEKSNSVSIAGPPRTVERAREMIRGLAPLVITFECGADFSAEELHAVEREFSNKFACKGITVVIRVNNFSGQPFVVVRGSCVQQDLVQGIVLALQQRLMSTMAMCYTSLEIVAVSQPSVMGVEAVHLQTICQLTGATIHYPRREVSAATTFFIQGTVTQVINAKKYLTGCLPLCAVFDLHSNTSVNVHALEKKLNVLIAVKPGREAQSKIVVIKGHEFQAAAVYEARNLLVCSEEPVVCSEYNFMGGFYSECFKQRSMTSLSSLSVNPGPIVLSPLPSPAYPVNTFLPGFVSSPFSPLNVALPRVYSCPQYHLSSQENRRYSNVSTSSGIGSSHSSPAGPPPLREHPDGGPAMVFNLNSAVGENTEPVPVCDHSLSTADRRAVELREKADDTSLKSYESEKLRAIKAMKESPRGVRVPNDMWAAKGFSRSLPPKDYTFSVNRNSADVTACLARGKMISDLCRGTKPSEEKGEGRGCENSVEFDFFPRRTSDDLDAASDMNSLLAKLHLTMYVDVFQEHDINMKTFLNLTDDDMKRLGIHVFGARQKLLATISEIKAKARWLNRSFHVRK